ncbi:MAG TPA: hypothetical protein VJI68_01870 [Candidatus Nanoarchaeia archaeon]|nr:hypothetical protein [Candidatus Nanoarchaeia archaeon]
METEKPNRPIYSEANRNLTVEIAKSLFEYAISVETDYETFSGLMSEIKLPPVAKYFIDNSGRSFLELLVIGLEDKRTILEITKNRQVPDNLLTHFGKKRGFDFLEDITVLIDSVYTSASSELPNLSDYDISQKSYIPK